MLAHIVTYFVVQTAIYLKIKNREEIKHKKDLCKLWILTKSVGAVP
jgi:hypothetical protein